MTTFNADGTVADDQTLPEITVSASRLPTYTLADLFKPPHVYVLAAIVAVAAFSVLAPHKPYRNPRKRRKRRGY